MELCSEVTRTGGEKDNHFDLTVVFHTTNIKPDDAHELRDAAHELLDTRDIGGHLASRGAYVPTVPTRQITVFVRSSKTVAIIHYETNDTSFGHSDFEKIERDSSQAIEHLRTIIGIFDRC